MLSRLADFLLDRWIDAAKDRFREARLVFYGLEAVTAALWGFSAFSVHPVAGFAGLGYSGMTLALWREHNRKDSDKHIVLLSAQEPTDPPGIAASYLALCYGAILSYPMMAGPVLLNGVSDGRRFALLAAMAIGSFIASYVTARTAGRSPISHALILGLGLSLLWSGFGLSALDDDATVWGVLAVAVPIPMALLAGRLRQKQELKHATANSAVNV